MRKRIKHIEIKPEMRVEELIDGMGKSGVFSAGKLAEAADIYREMVDSGSTIFMGVGGALVPGGLRKVLTDAINHGLLDVLVVNGANVTHDLIEAFGGQHLRGESTADDVKLHAKGLSRIYDIYIPQRSFELFEDRIQPMLAEVAKVCTRMSSAKLLREMGLRLEDDNSFLKAAADRGVPVFVPSLADSILGLQAWLFSQGREFIIDALLDVREIIEIASKAKDPGAVILGGGVPKNFILQAMLLAPSKFKYAIQITMDRPEHGGLSGAILEEAKSWGKITSDSRVVTVTGDAMIVFPFLISTILEKFKKVRTSSFPRASERKF